MFKSNYVTIYMTHRIYNTFYFIRQVKGILRYKTYYYVSISNITYKAFYFLFIPTTNMTNVY